jgi:hypothetical protein
LQSTKALCALRSNIHVQNICTVNIRFWSSMRYVRSNMRYVLPSIRYILYKTKKTRLIYGIYHKELKKCLKFITIIYILLRFEFAQICYYIKIKITRSFFFFFNIIYFYLLYLDIKSAYKNLHENPRMGVCETIYTYIEPVF